MEQKIDYRVLEQRIREVEGLSSDERSALLELLHTKKYGLVWKYKSEDVEERLRKNLPVLKEDKELALLDGGADAPNHILIEGDNLEALTALTYTHEGKVDVIYIDPPYNTGNKDFVYNDKFVDAEDAYRHSKWLSFMNKRLKIAKRLLSDRGVIFISIDDNEQANLKLLCDEVFGSEKFIATIPWRKRTAKADVPHSLSQDFEWILCYGMENFRCGIKAETRKYYITDDFPGKPWRVHDMTTQRTSIERPNCYFTIENPKTGERFPANPKRVWANNEETFVDYYNQGRIVFPGDYDFLRISKPVIRYFKDDDDAKAGDFAGFTTVSTSMPKEVGMTQDGTKDLDSVFGFKVFGFPKPLVLIKYILQISTPLPTNISILDFFAGSGTTLHATMQLNAEDGGKRQCILVTNNENNICRNVTYERNKRVIQGYTTPKGTEVEGLKNNNLRYYRVGYVERERSEKNMQELVRACTDLLCIKEDLYQEQSHLGTLSLEADKVRYFDDGKHRMLVIYQERSITTIVRELEEMKDVWADDEKIKVYLFSPSRYAYDDDFATVESHVALCALPAAIYDCYQRVLPKARVRPSEIGEEGKEVGE